MAKLMREKNLHCGIQLELLPDHEQKYFFVHDKNVEHFYPVSKIGNQQKRLDHAWQMFGKYLLLR